MISFGNHRTKEHTTIVEDRHLAEVQRGLEAQPFLPIVELVLEGNGVVVKEQSN